MANEITPDLSLRERARLWIEENFAGMVEMPGGMRWMPIRNDGEGLALHEVLAAFAASLTPAPPPTPGPCCPKCGKFNMSQICETPAHMRVTCYTEGCGFSDYCRGLADFAQFFPTLSPPQPARHEIRERAKHIAWLIMRKIDHVVEMRVKRDWMQGAISETILDEISQPLPAAPPSQETPK